MHCNNCYTVFLLINYCSDMFRPQFLAIFRELGILLSLYVNLLGRNYTYLINTTTKIRTKILKSLTLINTI